VGLHFLPSFEVIIDMHPGAYICDRVEIEGNGGMLVDALDVAKRTKFGDSFHDGVCTRTIPHVIMNAAHLGASPLLVSRGRSANSSVRERLQ
jgi:hypothetical protein